MTKMQLLALAVIGLLAQVAFGHPHSFVECTFSFDMDEKWTGGLPSVLGPQ
jgi:ABC-type uncharacterized transport system substrate-binding protein